MSYIRHTRMLVFPTTLFLALAAVTEIALPHRWLADFRSNLYYAEVNDYSSMVSARRQHTTSLEYQRTTKRSHEGARGRQDSIVKTITLSD